MRRQMPERNRELHQVWVIFGFKSSFLASFLLYSCWRWFVRQAPGHDRVSAHGRQFLPWQVMSDVCWQILADDYSRFFDFGGKFFHLLAIVSGVAKLCRFWRFFWSAENLLLLLMMVQNSGWVFSCWDLKNDSLLGLLEIFALNLFAL